MNKHEIDFLLESLASRDSFLSWLKFHNFDAGFLLYEIINKKLDADALKKAFETNNKEGIPCKHNTIKSRYLF